MDGFYQFFIQWEESRFQSNNKIHRWNFHKNEEFHENIVDFNSKIYVFNTFC